MNLRAQSRCSFAVKAISIAILMAYAFAADAADADGAAIYQQNCMACHQDAGVGLPGMAPPLRADSLKRLGPQASVYVAGVLLNGLSGVDLDGGFYPGPMPAWAALADADLAAVGNEVLGFNGLKPTLSAAQIAELRRQPAGKAELLRLRSGP